MIFGNSQTANLVWNFVERGDPKLMEMNGKSDSGSDLGAVLLLIEKIDRKIAKASTNLVEAQEKLAILKKSVAKMAKVWSESETSEGESSSSEEIFPGPQIMPQTPFPQWMPPQ